MREAPPMNTSHEVMDEFYRMSFIAYLNDDFLAPILATQKSRCPEIVNSAITSHEARKTAGSN